MKQIYTAFFIAMCAMVTYGQQTVDIHAPIYEENIGFKLYPNPVFDGVVYVTTKRNDSKDIIIYDVFGEVVLRDRIFTNSLNISKLVPGVYMLQVTENEKTVSRKLVVK
ncbi:MAG: T9SS type A sorting domain-containing protein [Bacteroidota bacterium]